jgi:hypothetical protein
VVVPTRDGEDRIPRVHAELKDALDTAYPDHHQIVYVDDGSHDQTWPIVEKLAAEDPAVLGIRLVGCGQVAALQAGFEAATGSVVAAMDDDLEIAPSELSHLIDALDDHVDFASARRTGPRSPLRAVGSAAFNRRLRRWGYPFHDVGCAFMAMKASVAQDLASQGGRIRGHRFKPAVVARGHRTVEVPLPSSRTSDSHFGLSQLIASWFDVEATLRPTVMLGLFWLGAIVAAVGTGAVVVGAVARSWGACFGGAWLILTGVALAGVGLVANQLISTLRHLEAGQAEVQDRTDQQPRS